MRINTGAAVVAGLLFSMINSASLSADTVIIAANDFDSLNSWSFSSDVPLFDNGADGFFDVTSASASGFEVITQLDNSFLGIRDLDDEGDNGAPTVIVNFDSIAVDGFENVSAGFEYQVVDWDGTDSIQYEWFVDGVGQGASTIGGQSNLSEFATIGFSPTGPAGTIALGLTVSQNGATDFAGLDNFQISGSVAAIPEPQSATPLALVGIALIPRLARRRKPLNMER